jgi:hypothetical protein
MYPSNEDTMRITVSHNRTKQEVIQSVDRSFDQLFQSPQIRGMKLKDVQRSWQGNTLNFSLNAGMGFLSTPIKGTIEVTDTDVTIDADLGMFERMIPADKARELISTQMKGLLN